ncbi:MAG: type I 3-dehydroquinate dehydratase [Clostridia bacterium]|nr:type I 3-dehydroquinate dehydratase [Clostridia bacterium]
MKKSFLNANTPFITEMVQVPTSRQAEEKIAAAVQDGATAIGFQMSALKEEYRTKEILTSIFEKAGDTPVYFTNYRRGFNEGKSDEELVKGLFFALDCGATLLDVMGDTFSPAPEELTKDPKAIEKQMKLIDEIHEKGGEVLMSSHVYEFRPAERVLEIAVEQQRRGADIVKIVTGANSQEQQLENLRICNLLKQELKTPFLFLSGGTHSYLHRTVGPSLGVCMWLCFREYDDTTYPGPPLLADVLKIKQGMKL